MTPPFQSNRPPREDRGRIVVVPYEVEAPVLQPPSAPEMLTSSPRIVTLNWFQQRFGRSDHRKNLIEKISRQIDHLPSCGAVPQFALVGGSFVGRRDHPADLDCIIGYRAASDGSPMADSRSWRLFAEIDVRFVPMDIDPLVTIKAFCFFHTLYLSLDKGLGQGSYMIRWRDE